MVFFNYATMQMAAKIVYYGPGLCGKTTNLHWIYAKTTPQSRGEMVSLETETDRTLFFDLLPLDVGVIGGFKTRLQLYTVPGQVFYNTTRKLVLKGVDGIVFVADLQRAMLDANVESFKNLRENLAEIGVNMDEVPLVLQLNKRDLPNIIERETLVESLDPEERYPTVESSAVSGEGVFETLKEISKLTLRTLRRRMMGEDASKGVAMRPSVVQQPARSREAPVGFNPPPAVAKAPSLPPPRQPLSPFSSPVASATAASVPQMFHPADPISEEPFNAIATEESPFPETTAMDTLLANSRTAEDFESLQEAPAAPPTEAEFSFESDAGGDGPSFGEPEPPAAGEPGVAPPENFDVAPQPKATLPPPPVKHVKLRSTAEIFAELDALRKSATQGGKASQTAAVTLFRSAGFSLSEEDLRTARTLHVALLFEDGDGNVVQQREAQIDLESDRDVQNIQLKLKIDKG
jgi:hypothetical protein